MAEFWVAVPIFNAGVLWTALQLGAFLLVTRTLCSVEAIASKLEAIATRTKKQLLVATTVTTGA